MCIAFFLRNHRNYSLYKLFYHKTICAYTGRLMSKRRTAQSKEYTGDRSTHFIVVSISQSEQLSGTISHLSLMSWPKQEITLKGVSAGSIWLLNYNINSQMFPQFQKRMICAYQNLSMIQISTVCMINDIKPAHTARIGRFSLNPLLAGKLHILR